MLYINFLLILTMMIFDQSYILYLIM